MFVAQEFSAAAPLPRDGPCSLTSLTKILGRQNLFGASLHAVPLRVHIAKLKAARKLKTAKKQGRARDPEPLKEETPWRKSATYPIIP